MSKVDLANAALIDMAQDIPIASFSEATKHARLFNRSFDRIRDLVLAEHSWPFALTSVALALQAQDPLPGWEYRYTYPSDCIDALAVCDENGIRQGISLASSSEIGQFVMWRNGQQAFEVVHGTQDTSIVTDQDLAYLIYVTRVDDVSRYPPLFAEAVIKRLAWMLAPAVMGDLGFKAQGRLQENYEMARAKAIAHAYNESRENVEATTPSLAARGA